MIFKDREYSNVNINSQAPTTNLADNIQNYILYFCIANHCFLRNEIFTILLNSNPGEMLHFVVSYLGLQCLLNIHIVSHREGKMIHIKYEITFF